MENISIRDKNNDILLYLDSNNIICYTNYNINVFDYLNLFKLSNNNTYIGKYNEYDIVLDNNSGLKHYIKDNIDNIELLFLNNGEDSIRYKDGNRLDSKMKIFRIKGIVICITCIGLVIANSLLLKPNNSYKSTLLAYTKCDDYEVTDLKDMIYSSTSLNEEEKKYIYNEEFLTDVINTINESNYTKNMYKQYFDNININSDCSRFKNSNSTSGYYDPITPNTIYIKDYEELDNYNKDILAHEFVHLCQDITGYNVITEACAEIISSEYYSYSKIDSYLNQTKSIKILMEIIGSDVIWDYCFNGDFSKIENRVKPYLSKEEYKEFINDLSYNYDNYDENNEKYESFKNILKALYKNMYNDDIENNFIINMIDNNDTNLRRYYFNSRKPSFYYNENSGKYMDISYKEAIDNRIILINAVYKEPLSNEQAFELIENTSSHIYRDIDRKNNEISIFRSNFNSKKQIISAIIDGVRYDDVDVDELVKKGIIKVDYYLVESKYLTYEEYMNNDYKEGSTITITKSETTTLNEDSVNVFVKDKVMLPNANELYESLSDESLSLKK